MNYCYIIIPVLICGPQISIFTSLQPETLNNITTVYHGTGIDLENFFLQNITTAAYETKTLQKLNITIPYSNHHLINIQSQIAYCLIEHARLKTKEQVIPSQRQEESNNELENLKKTIKGIEIQINILEQQKNKFSTKKEQDELERNTIVSHYGTNPLLHFVHSWLSKYPSWINKKIGPKQVTILHILCNYCNMECIKYLITLDSSIINIAESGGLYPLDIAFFKKDSPICELLISFGARHNPYFEKVLRYMLLFKMVPLSFRSMLPLLLQQIIQSRTDVVMKQMYFDPQKYWNLGTVLEKHYMVLCQNNTDTINVIIQ